MEFRGNNYFISSVRTNFVKFIKSLLSMDRNEKENTDEHIHFITGRKRKKEVMSPAKI